MSDLLEVASRLGWVDGLDESIKIGNINISNLLKNGFHKSTHLMKVMLHEPAVLYNWLNGDSFSPSQATRGTNVVNVYHGKGAYSDYFFTAYATPKYGVFNLYKNNATELVGYEKLPIKTFYKELGEFFTKPIRFGNVAFEKFSHFSKEGNRLYFVMSNGDNSTYVYLPDKSDMALIDEIDSKIKELESWGFKISKTEKDKLKIMFPELYGEVGFELSQKILPKISDEFSKTDPLFSKFVRKTDLNTRMSHGMTVSSSGIKVFGWVDNTSNGYRYKEVKFKKEPKTIKELVKFIKDSGVIPFVSDIQKRSDVYSSGFSDHVNATGGHAGNKVYMD